MEKNFKIEAKKIIFENLVQEWMFYLMRHTAKGSFSELQKQLGDVSTLSPLAQIAVLNEAKKLAQKMIDGNVTEAMEENGYLPDLYQLHLPWHMQQIYRYIKACSVVELYIC